MAILVPRWLDSSWQVRLQMCLKVCMVKIANRTRAQTRSAITPMFLNVPLRDARFIVIQIYYCLEQTAARQTNLKKKPSCQNADDLVHFWG